MRKKPVISQLNHGTHAGGPDRPWRETPMLVKSFGGGNGGVADSRQRRQYVDAVPRSRADTRRAPQAKPLAAQRTPRLRVVASNAPVTRPQQLRADKINAEQEATAIRKTYDDAVLLMQSILEAVHRSSNKINIEGAKNVVPAMVASVLRNPDALVCLAQQKKRDHYTALHCVRVCILALAFGRHLGLAKQDLNLLGLGALLHDIGKMRVPDAIVNKPSKLTEREYQIMQSHVPIGAEILQRTGAIPPPALDVARHIHERYAGHGYMDGLSGDEISAFGRIGAIVDVYDALTSDRIYEDGIPAREALRRMYERRGEDFDPQLLDQFIQCIGVYPIGSVVVLNTFEVGVVRMLNGEQRLKPQIALATRPDKTRYPTLRVVDLACETAPTGEPYQIIEVVAPATVNIDPVDYLPVKAPV